MSSRAVRQAVRGWVAGLVTPYYDTINTNQTPRDQIWLTVEFNSFGMTKMSFCNDWIEDGDITLTFFGPPGTGDDALLQQAETDAATFFASVDPAGKVVLLDQSAPEDFQVTENGPRFGIAFRFGYQYQK